MARKRTTRAKAKKTTTEKRARPVSRRREREEVAAVETAEAIEEEAGERAEWGTEMLLIFTAVFLIGAILLNLVHLGSSYGVGVFK